MHCSAAYAGMEAAMYNTYDANHEAIQDKLQELFAVLDRIGMPRTRCPKSCAATRAGHLYMHTTYDCDWAW